MKDKIRDSSSAPPTKATNNRKLKKISSATEKVLNEYTIISRHLFKTII